MTNILAKKHPDNIEPYFIVWCDPDGSNVVGDDGELQGATIDTATWTVTDGLTQVSDSLNAVTIDGVTYPANTVCTLWVSGGTSPNDYNAKCVVELSDGRTLARNIVIPVREHS